MIMKINIAELLKDCPKGIELDCTMWDNVSLIQVSVGKAYPIKIKTPDGLCLLNQYGCYSDHEHAKCVIFPKGKTTWEGFVPPCEFKDGDILTNERGSICIYKGPMYYNQNLADFYCGYRISDHAFILKKFRDKHFGDVNELRLASEIEKQHFFQILLDNGYKWNPETKTLEKLIKPKFKVGDYVAKKGGITVPVLITKVSDDFYYSNTEKSMGFFSIKDQDDWELVPKKFDINTLIPFKSRMLARDTKEHKWVPAIWGDYDNADTDFPYKTIGSMYKYCIPYEGNEHLLGTANDCNEFYKTW